VAACCNPTDYRRLFSSKQARRDARRFRRRGLRGTSQDLVELAGDVHGASVLDVGGGVGAIELELLAAGAERATNIELSGGYEQTAAGLIAERGVEARIDRHVGDFVTAEIDPHDLVVMHRVVCCYPDVDALVGNAADRARHVLLLTYPQESPMVRLGFRAMNLWLRLSGCGFRAYVHRSARIAAIAEEHGLRLEQTKPGGRVWMSAAYRRMPV
jgi:2-polyprenyl-3-methyl-5-hydroxy-6-metoxy-1,4-benzoquinol methylase